ncbi:[acyl-carrier-protein] S-malonyltransferase [Allopseudospirillum japonicum]|uniref:Malonyl CoA-acyl carrier protein transacylase n=1 Tax=Allopseudospirillum japonicum TaxID=64971 RepID=A0A1H6Q5E5_9GAMM|nr:ACP S-malonyltransferase [Allopseudospirillum japonicum]SEI39039.1 [acyl-carrier-protein] S-malonyltransferase [Allopseudospirillum japonicum]
MTKSLAFLFPGQGSQHLGMLSELSERYAVVRTSFEEASDAMEYDLWQLVQEGPLDLLNATQYTQPALLTASVAVWRVWQELEGHRPAYMAGHSLGEYSALVCSGALDFAAGVRLVHLRGQAMQAAVPAGEGAMAAILGLEDQQVQAACEEASQGEVVAAVNYNAPGQVVIAGSKSAVERAISACQVRGARKAMPLPVSVPSHCALMRPAAERVAQALAEITFEEPRIPVVQNVDAQAHTQPQVLKDNVLAQLYSPVLWSKSVSLMTEQGVNTLIECGPGKVLVGLAKRIHKPAKALAMNDSESVAAALELTRMH